METNYQRIKELRKEKKASQQKFSKLTKVPLSSLKAIETGRMQLSEENAIKISKVFNISPHEFYMKSDEDTIENNKNTKVLTVLSHKGGVGKSSISSNLAYTLADMGYKVLAIDSDFQMNLTQSYGIKINDEEELEKIKGLEKNIYLALTRKDDISKHIIPTQFENLDLVPGSSLMSGVEIPLYRNTAVGFTMKKILKNIVRDNIYDFIIIDTHATLGVVNMNMLNASHELIIPLELSSFGVEGLHALLNYYTEIYEETNEELNIAGIVFNKVDARKEITKNARDVVKDVFGDLVFKTEIGIDTQIEKAQWAGLPLPLFNKNSRATKQFKDLAKEVLANVQR